MNVMQTRYCDRNVQLRGDDQDGPKTCFGYSAVFYNEADERTQYLLYEFRNYRMIERLMPGCFDRALKDRHDVRCLFNHNSSLILGRTESGTCRLAVDGVGLAYENDLDMTQSDARDTYGKIKRKDVTGSSFQFIPTDYKTWEERVDDKTTCYLEIRDVELFDVGPVTFPAYTATTTGVRSAMWARSADQADMKAFIEEVKSRSGSELRLAESRAIEHVLLGLDLDELEAAGI